MKQAFPAMVGNRALCRKLYADVMDEKLSHAYIVEGPAGSGKHTLARNLAAAISCEARSSASLPLPCGVCPSCKKILGGFSTDVIEKNRGDKATFGVDVIREVRQDVYVAPNEAKAKVYLIEEADLMTQQAQNAFLLTLEEPPAYAMFFLLCESATPLLETIRSRAPTLRTEPIDLPEIDAYLMRVSPEAAALKQTAPQEYSEILAAANGCIGHALALLDPKTRKPITARRQIARSFVHLCAARKNAVATMRFLATLAQKRDELSEQLTAILICLRDLLLCKQTEQAPLCFFTDREEALSLSYGFTTPTLLALCDCVQGAIDQLRANANVNLTLTALANRAELL